MRTLHRQPVRCLESILGVRLSSVVAEIRTQSFFTLLVRVVLSLYPLHFFFVIFLSPPETRDTLLLDPNRVCFLVVFFIFYFFPLHSLGDLKRTLTSGWVQRERAANVVAPREQRARIQPCALFVMASIFWSERTAAAYLGTLASRAEPSQAEPSRAPGPAAISRVGNEASSCALTAVWGRRIPGFPFPRHPFLPFLAVSYSSAGVGERRWSMLHFQFPRFLSVGSGIEGVL